MNKIIIYFSYSGHTREIANKIKEKLNCDILELEPVIPYSKDYNRVVEEEQNNSSNNNKFSIGRKSLKLKSAFTHILPHQKAQTTENNQCRHCKQYHRVIVDRSQ